MTKEKGIIENPGQCMICGGVFEKRAMARHLKSCREKSEEKKRKGRIYSAFHLLIEGKHLPEYWLHVAVPVVFSLSTLDWFLRDIWLECCGHLSDFVIRGKHYLCQDDEYGEYENMEVPLSAVLGLGEKFFHDYDFGTTTRLALRVLGLTTVRGKAIEFLARNEPPFIPCEKCGRAAELVCGYCSHMGSGWLCAACARKHRCQTPRSFLPVANSPRTGLCGYTGPLS